MFYQTPMTFSPHTQKEKFSLVVHTMKMSVKGLSSSNKKQHKITLKSHELHSKVSVALCDEQTEI